MKKRGKQEQEELRDPQNAALYARVSDKDQNVALQLADLREMAKNRGWHVVGEFVDIGWSGAKDSRPQLDKMMKLVSEQKVNLIAVWKLDRFGRSVGHLVNALDRLQAAGCAFVSVRDALDLSTPAGRMMFHVIAAMAEFERDLIRERVSAGMARAKREGRNCGRPKVVVNLDKILELRNAGMSATEIGNLLGCSWMTILRRLKQARQNS